MSTRKSDETHAEETRSLNASPTQILAVDVCAAYNLERLPIPQPNGPNGRRVLNIEMLMNHAFYWEWLNERETEEVLMELYKVRTRRMQ